MDAAIAAFVRKCLKAEITFEHVHALDYPPADVSGQGWRAWSFGLRRRLLSLVQHSHGERLGKAICVKPFVRSILVRIGEKQRHKLLCGGIMKIYLNAQLSAWSALHLGIESVHKFGVQCAHYEIEIALSAQHW